jgi:hypothetical protein
MDIIVPGPRAPGWFIAKPDDTDKSRIKSTSGMKKME